MVQVQLHKKGPDDSWSSFSIQTESVGAQSISSCEVKDSDALLKYTKTLSECTLCIPVA